MYTLIDRQFLKMAYAWEIESMSVHKHMKCVCVCTRVCFVTDKQQY